MRILFLYDHLSPRFQSGSARLLTDVGGRLAAAGHEVVILTASATPDEFPIIPGIAFRFLPPLTPRWAHWRSVFSRKRAAEVLALIDEVRPDVIHGHLLTWQMGFRWIAGAVVRGIPCFCTFHSVIAVAYGKVLHASRRSLWDDLRRARWTYNPLRNVLTRRLLRRARLLAVSDALRRFMEGYGYGNITVLGNGVDATFWTADLPQAEARRQLRLPPDVPLFLLAGRLGTDKGLNLLLSLWPHLSGGPHLVLAGSVPAFALNQPFPVHHFKDLGPEDMRTLYRACDANLVPSLCFDSLPTTSLESMACGIPAVVGNRGGGPEEVSDGVTGFVVDPADPSQVQAVIQRCVDQRGSLPAMGAHAREDMIHRFSLPVHVEMLLRLYESSLLP